MPQGRLTNLLRFHRSERCVNKVSFWENATDKTQVLKFFHSNLSRRPTTGGMAAASGHNLAINDILPPRLSL